MLLGIDKNMQSICSKMVKADFTGSKMNVHNSKN